MVLPPDSGNATGPDERAVVWTPGLPNKSCPFSVVPTRISYWETPTPRDQVNVVGDVNWLVVGVSNTEAVGVPHAV